MAPRVAAIAGIVAAAVLPTGTASAHHLDFFPGDDGACDTGDLCVWKDNGATGPRFAAPGLDANWVGNRWWDLDVSPINEDDSVQNRWSIDVGMYTGAGYTGTQWCFPSSMGTVHTFGGSNDNDRESHKAATFNC